MNIILTTEWNEKHGGAEFVNSVICNTFDPKPICYSVYNHSELLETTKQSFLLSKLQFLPKKIIGFLSLFHHLIGVPSSTELLISSSFLFAHCSRIRRRNGKYLVYVHTPARYLWAPQIDNRASNGSFVTLLIIELLKRIDKLLVNKRALYIANSQEVAKRIDRSWGVSSEVVHPPVDVEYFTRFLRTQASVPITLITGGRLVPYKGHLECIQFSAKTGMKLEILGSGPEETQLRKAARALGADVEFIISPTRQELAYKLGQASVFLHLAYEDFGILPIEAMAAGTPVVGIAKGGLLETVNSINGVLVDSAEELEYAVKTALNLDRRAVSESVQIYKSSNFQKQLSRILIERWPELRYSISKFGNF